MERFGVYAVYEQLHHPNIVPHSRVGQLDDTTSVEMEHLVGSSLDELLHEIRTGGPPPIDVVVSLMFELADALAFAHERGVVHGDIRPCHLLVDSRGHLKVLGFGTAQLEQPLAQHCYAAPESMNGEPPNEHADLYSLGVVAYELVTGRPLFDEHLNPELRSYLGSCICPPSTINRNCPRQIDELLLGALAPDPDERWAKVSDLRGVLEFLGGPSPECVREWLGRAALHAHPPARGAVPPSPRGELPAPPRRLARGTGRLPSPSEVTRPPELDESLHETDDSIHDAKTVIRHATPPPRRSLRLPLEPPSGPYADLEIADDNGAPDEVSPASAATSVEAPEKALAAPPLPVFAPTAWDEAKPAICPTGEPRVPRRYLEVGLAFLAGALAMYSLVTWLG